MKCHKKLSYSVIKKHWYHYNTSLSSPPSPLQTCERCIKLKSSLKKMDNCTICRHRKGFWMTDFHHFQLHWKPLVKNKDLTLEKLLNLNSSAVVSRKQISCPVVSRVESIVPAAPLSCALAALRPLAFHSAEAVRLSVTGKWRRTQRRRDIRSQAEEHIGVPQQTVTRYREVCKGWEGMKRCGPTCPIVNTISRCSSVVGHSSELRNWRKCAE